MRLLIATQVVDSRDPILGFFHRWIEVFARHSEQVTVICLKEGDHTLPSNVRVYSLGKERGTRSFLIYSLRFFKLAYELRNSYDTVFVHMNPEYIGIAGPLWKLLGKRIGLWYLHGAVSWRLRMGIMLADRVFTASKSSMRVETQKKRIVGHGLDETIYSFVSKAPPEPLTFVTVSRISRIKNIDLILQAFIHARAKGIIARLRVVGGVPASDTGYLNELHDLVERSGIHDCVEFVGPKDVQGVQEVLASAHLFLHTSSTGSIDKAPLEALSVGVPVITVNPELASLGTPAIIYSPSRVEAFAETIVECVNSGILAHDDTRVAARAVILDRFRLDALVKRILAEYGTIGQSKSMNTGEESTQDHFNRVAREAIGSSYEDRRWKQSERTKQQFAHTQDFIRAHALSSVQHAKTVLELGPGPGTWTRMLNDANPSAKFILTDISFEMLERARGALPSSASVETREGEFLSAPLAKGEADFFFSSRAIEYVGDTKKAAEKIYDVLKPGGRGCVITKTPKRLENTLRGYTPSKLHQGQITPRLLVDSLRAAGFKHVRAYPVTFSFPFLKSAYADRAIGVVLSWLPLNPLSKIFTESYGVTFDKA